MSSSDGVRSRRRTVLTVVVAIVALLVVAGVVGAVRLRANITVLDVNDALADPGAAQDEAEATADASSSPTPNADPDAGEPVTILVMGSDTRQGQGDDFGSVDEIEGARSDTTLLVHLSADRERVLAMSIPRDLMVTLPACTMEDGTSTSPYVDRFNAAFAIGGPECTIRAATELTGLPINHFVVVDFDAFERTIDALGGVEVCLTEAVDDPKSGLDLPAGVSRVDGEQGLAFVRARTSLGDGSDLARIERQQVFLGSLVREATSRDLLTDPLRLLRSLDTATQSLTMDAGLAWLPRAAGLASSLAGLDPSDVTFVTYPNVYNDGFITVRPDPDPALLLTELIAADAPWPPPPSADAVDVPPSEVAVSVVNGSGRLGEAQVAAAALGVQGMVVVSQSLAEEAASSTQVRYSSGNEDAAATVAAAVDGARLVPDDSVEGVVLVLGGDWSVADVRTVRVADPEAEADADSGGTSGGADGGTATPAPSDPAQEGTTAERATCVS